MIKPYFLLLILFFSFQLLYSDEGVASIKDVTDFSKRLGADIEEVWTMGEIPLEVFSYRQESAVEDNVVFYYSGYRYLFLFKGRVWQIRFDSRYTGNFDGLKMGLSAEEVIGLKGPPLYVEEDSLIYQEEDRGYPVQSRLYFTNGLLSDYYLYRSDY